MPPVEELKDVTDDKFKADYEPEVLDPSEKPEAHEEKEVSKAEYANMQQP